MSTVTLPGPRELGLDLYRMSRCRRFFILGRPFLVAGATLTMAATDHPVCMVGAMPWVMASVVVATHDVTHGNLGLSRRSSDVLLCLLGLLVLESGHSYRITHRRHHQQWPTGLDDPEGRPARMSAIRSLLEGPVFLPRLWLWSWRHAPGQRRWLCAEAVAAVGLLTTGCAWLTEYAVLCVLGSWLYPLLGVRLQHRAGTSDPLLATRTRHGRLLPKLSLGLTYHLEHHLYPRVPSSSYSELARRLESRLER